MSETCNLHPDWLDRPEIRKLASAFRRAGRQLWFVGGAVRDALLGREADLPDIDAATDALPEEVIRIARKSGFKAVPTGIEHGTVTVIVDGLPAEITTLREDVETDGRHAKVAFGTSLEADANRRDFTINALYLNPEGTLIDPVGGGADLARRRIRFIGDPRARIREDYLRILRLFRMFANFGDPETGLDPEALAAARELAGGLLRISPERIGQEMRKLLSAPDPVPALRAMEAAGILARILPSARAQSLARLVGLEKRLGISPDPLRRLAALGGEDVASRLRLSRREAKRLALLHEAVASDAPPFELGYRLGREDGLSALLLRHARAGTEPEAAEIEAVEKGAGARFPIRGRDLVPLVEGPALGQLLRRLEKAWLESGGSLDKEALLALARRSLAAEGDTPQGGAGHGS